MCICIYDCVCEWRASRAAELAVPLHKAKAVPVCMCLCQHDGGEGSYSDIMNPSAFKGHSSPRTQAGANEQRPGSLSSLLKEGGGGGVLRLSLSKADWQRQVLNSPDLFP